MTASRCRASSISVQVVNGTGVTDQATQTSQALQALGFHVAGLGDASAVGAEAETVVYYAANTPSDLAAAQTVARSISGAAIMAQDASEVPAGANVTVVTGTDFAVRHAGAGHDRHDRHDRQGQQGRHHDRGAHHHHHDHDHVHHFLLLVGVQRAHAQDRGTRPVGSEVLHAERR